MIFYQPSAKGFSLVEVLVAISILLLVITGPMTMISRANNSTAFATEQITAFFIAQEGLELVQKQRDDFLLEYYENPIANPSPWADFKDYFTLCDVASHPNGCALQIQPGTGPNVEVVRDCDTLSDCRLQLNGIASNPRRRRFHYDAGDPNSLFTRAVKMEVINTNLGTQEVKITATVTWRTGSLIREQKVEATTFLFNVRVLP
jgi:prepilin-type N-terminal cleavage/methylation domain-containing protein